MSDWTGAQQHYRCQYPLYGSATAGRQRQLGKWSWDSLFYLNTLNLVLVCLTCCPNTSALGFLTSSLACLDQARLQTWEPVSVLCSAWPVSVFQKRRQRSAVPPPDASSPCWWGDQAMAFTAARWSLYCCTGSRLELFHTNSWQGTDFTLMHYSGYVQHAIILYYFIDSESVSLYSLTLLSFPPDARCWWSGDHLRPHTSCLCPCSLLSAEGGVLTSRWRITLSRLPDDSCSPFHARAPWRQRVGGEALRLHESRLLIQHRLCVLYLYRIPVLLFRPTVCNSTYLQWRLTYTGWVTFQTGQLPSSCCVPDLNVTFVGPNGNQTSLT